MIEDLFKPEILLILFVIIFFLFGAQRLPGLGKSLGHGIREFRNGIAGAADSTPEEIAAETASPVAGETPAGADVIEGEAHEVPADADVIEGEAHEVPADAGEERAAV